MANPTLVVRELSRFPIAGPEDTLEFKSGVNLLVGPPNTGKTKWMAMLDYLLGDDGDPAEKFEELYEKYESVKAVCTVGDREVTIERRWREKGLKTKAVVDGTVTGVDELHELYLSQLGMSTFRFPQGNPYGPRTWPTLGWRGLVRHMYRRQKMWTDLADQQHESEQHACVTQFLGIGERLFSGEYAELVQKENRIRALEFERDQFLNTLDKVTREIVDVKELGVAVTPQSVDDAVSRLHEQIAELAARRQSLLEAAVRSVEEATPARSDGRVEQLGEELSRLRVRQDEVQASLLKTEERLREVTAQKAVLQEELARLRRAETASRLLPKLRITHCPACDQPISEPDEPSDMCFLCKRQQPPAGNSEEFAKRVEFERQQIAGEISETDELVKDLTAEVTRLKGVLATVAERVHRIQTDLRPVRIAVAAVIPPEVTLFDVESGRLQERLSQLERIRTSLTKREAIAEQIRRIQEEVDRLERQVKEHKTDVDLGEASQRLQDGFNTYLNRIVETNPTSWTQTVPVRVAIRERDFSIKVGKTNWKTKLGGAQSLLFLIAYHYALMNLTQLEGCHYPGFAALDFPAKLDDGSPGIGKDQENFVVVPFIRLLSAEEMKTSQLIVAGNSFDGLTDVHRVQLTRIWSETE